MATTRSSPVLVHHSSPPPSLDPESMTEHAHTLPDLAPGPPPSRSTPSERSQQGSRQEIADSPVRTPLEEATIPAVGEGVPQEDPTELNTDQASSRSEVEEGTTNTARTTSAPVVTLGDDEQTDVNDSEGTEVQTNTAATTTTEPTDIEMPDAPARPDSEESRPSTPHVERKVELPDWVGYEDDLSVPSEEELKEVEGTEAELDALDIPALEKRIYQDLDDPEQRPIKKLRLSWVIKGVRGTKENPNYARVMNSPYAHVDGYYWQIKFYPRGNKSSSLSAYIKCSRQKPKADEETVESEFTYFEGSPETRFGRDMDPLNVIKVAATPPKAGRKPSIDAKGFVKKDQSASGTHDPVPAPTNREDFLLFADEEARQQEAEASATTDSPVDEDVPTEDWRVSAQLGMVIYNPSEPRSSQLMSSEHQFNKHNDDWGWTNFLGPWDKIHIRKKGQRQALLRDDQIAIDAYIRIFDDPSQMLWWHESEAERLWDSKSLAGYWPMGTPPLYHSPSVAGMTSWLLLAPFRKVIQDTDALKWREDSNVKPAPFLAHLQMVLYTMRYLDPDMHSNYVNVYPAIEALSGLGESWIDVKTFWDVFRRTIELELGDDRESLEQISTMFDAPSTAQEVSIPPLPVQGVHDVQSGINKVLSNIDRKGCFPNFLPVLLERQSFDKEVREWKLHHDRVHLNEEIDLSKWTEAPDDGNYTLYGFLVHAGDRNSNRFYSILRPAGPGTKWLAFEDGDGNKIFSYTRHHLREYEGLEGQELKDFKGTRQTAYMAMYIRDSCLDEYLSTSMEPYQLPAWLKPHLVCGVSDKDHPPDTDKKDDDDQDEDVNVEIYADTAVRGRHGLLDMYNLKNKKVAKDQFIALKVPKVKIIKELRADLADMLGIDKVEKIRLWEMSYESVGRYTSANMEPVKLYRRVGPKKPRHRMTTYLCLWMSILESDEDVQRFGYPDPDPAPPVSMHHEEQDDDEDAQSVVEDTTQAEGTDIGEGMTANVEGTPDEESGPDAVQASVAAAVTATIAERQTRATSPPSDTVTGDTADSVNNAPAAEPTTATIGQEETEDATLTAEEWAAPALWRRPFQAPVLPLPTRAGTEETAQTRQTVTSSTEPATSSETQSGQAPVAENHTPSTPTNPITVIQAQIDAASDEILLENEIVIASLIAADAQAADLTVFDLTAQSDHANISRDSHRAIITEPQRPLPHFYGFIQFFDAELQTFTVLSTFFAPLTANVHTSVRAHPSLTDKVSKGDILLWRRESSCTTIFIPTAATFDEINFSDGVDIIVGNVLSESQISDLQTQGKFTDPASLSKYLWMTERRHPILSLTTSSAIEVCAFGSDYYKGPLVRGQCHGPECITITSTGHTYTGPLVCSLKQGAHGTMTYASGDTYSGSWHNDERHGQGTLMEKRTGNKYVGGWENGKKWGKGVTNWEVAEEEGKMCQICFVEEIDALFYECGHVVACEACSRMCDVCPICRRTVKAVVRMYRA